jgi:hypothetical protein
MMNDRIKELAEQAMVSISYRVCQNTFKEIDDPAGPFVRKEFDKEKFAELIIRECMNAVCDPRTTYLESMTDSSAMYAAREKIRKHFGG